MRYTTLRKKIIKATYPLRSPVLDIGKADDLIILAGMGRSGTTWIANIINHRKDYRLLFEPFYPAKVPEARSFRYIQYLPPDFRDDPLVANAKKITAGKVRSSWVDSENAGIGYKKRLLKDIRCNLMLEWLRQVADAPPTVLIVRHPLQVIASWLKLGWGTAPGTQTSDFEVIISQAALLQDYPRIQQVLSTLDKSSSFERILFQWCVFYFVPLQQLNVNKSHLLFYENLVLRPKPSITRLFDYLEMPLDWEKVQPQLQQSSHTNFLRRDHQHEKIKLSTSK